MNYNKQYDCSKLVITTILKDCGINTDVLWPHFGTFFIEEDKQYWPYLYNNKQQLYKYNNIIMEDVIIDDSITFESYIYNYFISNNTSIMVPVDIFFVPSNPYYKEKNNLHYVEVKKMRNKYLLVDHFYKIEQYIELKVLYSIYEKSDIFQPKKINIFDLSNYYQPNKKEVVREIVLDFLKFEDEYTISKKFKDDILNMLLDLERNIEVLYSTLKQFAYSRYQFSHYIYSLENRETSEKFKEIANCYLLLSNVILKYYISSRDLPIDFINNTLDRIFIMENSTAKLLI